MMSRHHGGLEIAASVGDMTSKALQRRSEPQASQERAGAKAWAQRQEGIF